MFHLLNSHKNIKVPKPTVSPTRNTLSPDDAKDIPVPSQIPENPQITIEKEEKGKILKSIGDVIQVI